MRENLTKSMLEWWGVKAAYPFADRFHLVVNASGYECARILTKAYSVPKVTANAHLAHSAVSAVRSPGRRAFSRFILAGWILRSDLFQGL